MSDARGEILARVRAALRDVPAGETAADVAVPRDYRREGRRDRDAVVALFAERCADYRATVRRVQASTLPNAIAAALADRGARRIALGPGVPEAWLGGAAGRSGAGASGGGTGGGGGVAWVADDPPLSPAELDAVDGVLSGCAVAIAETGAIALDHGPGQGRRALTLIPDYHLCVVRAEQIVELVPEAIARLHESARAGRPITFVAGPSATSDIEMRRVEGVHGPRTLDVLLVG